MQQAAPAVQSFVNMKPLLAEMSAVMHLACLAAMQLSCDPMPAKL